MDREDLKIQFRSVRFLSNDDSRVIEYRVDPEQDIYYTKEVRKLFGLIKKTVTHKYDTAWTRPRVMHFYASLKTREDTPIWTHEHDFRYNDLAWFKSKFNTIGEFESWLDEQDKTSLKEYNDYLSTLEPDIIY